MMQELKGLGVAMVTPFSDNQSVDYAGLERLVKHLHKGADYLVVMGTTGESATLSEEEQMAVLGFVTEINAGKLPIVYGMGGNATAALARRMADFPKADHRDVVAFLSVSPYYNKPNQEGIVQHYKALSTATPLPIIAYNVPGRTGSNILPETTLRLAQEARKVIGIKEAAASIEQVMHLARILPPDFLLISGDDALVLPHMACGGHGVISVVGNAYPDLFGKMVHAAAAGDYATARALHYRILPLISSLFAEGNPTGIKEVLRHLGICGNAHRLPLVPASKGLSEGLYGEVALLG